MRFFFILLPRRAWLTLVPQKLPHEGGIGVRITISDIEYSVSDTEFNILPDIRFVPNMLP